MISFQKATNKAVLLLIEQMADVIWREHYTPIIGKAQVDYMLEKFQSVSSMTAQIEENYNYYLIRDGGEAVGYLAYEKRKENLFLSKIYVLSGRRGRGIGKTAMDFVAEQAAALNCSGVSLTVNKNNIQSIKAYERLGFVKGKSVVMDIGGGFVMDDYEMHKSLSD